MNLTKRPEVGDRLIWRGTEQRRYASDMEVTVTKVGRRWVTAEPERGFREVKFDIETGFEDCGQFMSQHRAVYPGQLEQEIRRAEALAAIRKVFGAYSDTNLGTDTLEAIAALIADTPEPT